MAGSQATLRKKDKKKDKGKGRTGYQATPEVETRPETADLKKATEDLMDEIDAVLEENPLETLRSYRQRGGQ